VTLPTTIRVGPFEIAVKVYADADMPHRNPDPDILSMGRWIENKSEIAICADLDQQSTIATLWHEILHAVFDQRGIPHNESYIDTMTYALIELVRANPELIEATTRKRFNPMTENVLRKLGFS
jgi:Zn-dependent peptidase ImmA (M78 family)